MSGKSKLPRNKKTGREILVDPRLSREDEAVGGGWFVFRRTQATGRIRVPEWPFEHPTQEAAEAERDRLAELFGAGFVVAQVPTVSF